MEGTGVCHLGNGNMGLIIAAVMAWSVILTNANREPLQKNCIKLYGVNVTNLTDPQIWPKTKGYHSNVPPTRLRVYMENPKAVLK